MKETYNANDFYPVRTPNKEYVADLIMEIKGSDRSMAEFAEDIGVSTSMLSRIINGAYLKHISFDILSKIMSGARDTCKISFLEFANANGLETRKQIERREQKENDRKKRMLEERQNRTRCEELIINKLLSKGYAIKRIDRLRGKPTSVEDLFPVEIGGDFRIEVLGDERNYPWHFMINPYTSEENESDMRKTVHVKRMFQYYALLFLQTEWNREAFEGRKISFVFVDKAYYEYFFELLKNANIGVEMTAILVDTVYGNIIEECDLRFDNYGCTNSIFDVSSNDQEDEVPSWEDDGYNEWDEDEE